MLWSPNLQLHYPFENQADDYSGNARHGTVHGSGVYATRPNAGRCLYFDGVGDYVSTPSFGLSGTVVVFACWIRCKNYAVPQDIFCDGYSATVGFFETFRVANSTNLGWEYANGSTVGLATATSYFASPYNDAWVHLCVVCDYSGKYVYFYRVGIPFGSPVAMSGTPAFPSYNVAKRLGSSSSSSILLTDGYLANVQLWTLATMPPLGQMTANVNRLMLGMNPIW